MKRILVLWAAVGLAVSAWAVTPDEQRVAGVPDVHFVGDSTIVTRKATSSNGVWTAELSTYLGKNNRGHSFAGWNVSARLWLESGSASNCWSSLHPGDFVLIQFGRYDCRTDRPQFHSSPETFVSNLLQIAAAVREKGAVPCFVTPYARRAFDRKGRLSADGVEDYVAATKRAAKEAEAACLDMFAVTRAILNDVGAEACDPWYMRSMPEDQSPRDNLHLTRAGARRFAEAMLAEIRAKAPDLAALFPMAPEPKRRIPVVEVRRERTPEAARFFERLKGLSGTGRWVHSWTCPWDIRKRVYSMALSNCYDVVSAGVYRPRPVAAADLGHSRVKELAGKDPLVYFTEFAYVAGSFYGKDIYARSRAAMETMVKKAYRDYGAIPVFSWHPENPYTPDKAMIPKYGSGSMYNYKYTVPGYPQKHRFVFREILDGTGEPCGAGRSLTMARYSIPETDVVAAATPREWYKARLREICDFINRLTDESGRPIPLVVRLFHECEDDWPWWGRGSATRDEYVRLFRITVEAIRRGTNGGKQLLFLYSPDKNWLTLDDADSKTDFMYRYPGDEYVDIIGYDDYSIGKPDKDRNGERIPDSPEQRAYAAKNLETTIRKMRWITAEAKRRGKACGLVETGYLGAFDDGYDYLYRALTAPGVGFSFVNSWTISTIPGTDAGKDCFKRYLARPEVLTWPGAAGLWK